MSANRSTRRLLGGLGKKQKARMEERLQKASKETSCDGCRKAINKGEKYVRCMWPGESADHFILRKFHRKCRKGAK